MEPRPLKPLAALRAGRAEDAVAFAY